MNSYVIRSLFQERFILLRLNPNHVTKTFDHRFTRLCCIPSIKYRSFSHATCKEISPSSVQVYNFTGISKRSYASSNQEPQKKVSNEQDDEIEQYKKLSLFKRFKQMYRDYWYVLLPVHIATSAVWVAGLYYIAKSGVDVVALLESLGAGERIMSLVNNSSTGYFAITYALYKIATPARYFVTLGGTTISINYLKKWGYIKPIPPKDKLKEMIQERKDNFKDNLRERKDNFFKSRHKE